MSDHPLCPPHDLPATPCQNFFYCPHPLELAPETFDALFPAAQQEDFIRGVFMSRLAASPTHTAHPTAAAMPNGEPARELAADWGAK